MKLRTLVLCCLVACCAQAEEKPQLTMHRMQACPQDSSGWCRYRRTLSAQNVVPSETTVGRQGFQSLARGAATPTVDLGTPVPIHAMNRISTYIRFVGFAKICPSLWDTGSEL